MCGSLIRSLNIIGRIGKVVGTRVCAFYFVVGLLIPALAGTSLASPEPKPSATPNVWVDQDLARDCELHVPCVQSVQLAVNIVDPSGSVFVYALPWSYNESDIRDIAALGYAYV